MVNYTIMAPSTQLLTIVLSTRERKKKNSKSGARERPRQFFAPRWCITAKFIFLSARFSPSCIDLFWQNSLEAAGKGRAQGRNPETWQKDRKWGWWKERADLSHAGLSSLLKLTVGGVEGFEEGGDDLLTRLWEVVTCRQGICSEKWGKNTNLWRLCHSRPYMH